MARKTNKKSGKRTLSARAVSLGLLLMVLIIAELFCFTWCRFECAHVRFDISEAEDEQERLMVVQKVLEVERARLKSPERLALIAETSLGLKLPTSRQMVVVE